MILSESSEVVKSRLHPLRVEVIDSTREGAKDGVLGGNHAVEVGHSRFDLLAGGLVIIFENEDVDVI